ncbi:MAG: hypothetical protein K5790_10500 [Nitrosopumilus sp.]|uniref:hypothetical protein n=1 Tax=Nitrosopumilus sp. TaxID=2024843 RepID=UPI00247C7779|nr:hypothetical protein [Nitrosopumilus sp.]MCV0393700.1 hypothetical protein [Nitrosopumilus sp.]
MPSRCEFVDPEFNFPCGKVFNLTKIIFNHPKKKEPIVKFACKPDGDRRFRYLSMTEEKLSTQYKQNKIKYEEFKEEMKQIRWKRCRRCNGEFESNEVACNITYYYWKDGMFMGLRRSFQLHDDCMERELKLFNIQKEDVKSTITTLDSVM